MKHKEISDKQKTIALCGNPNVGKSTVFNALTGLRQHTGNWSGKTVEIATGFYDGKKSRYEIVDLPGTYSLSSDSAEEQVTKDFILKEKPDAVIVICDAGCLERNMALVLQVLSITPMVVVGVNLMDEAQKKGIKINLKLISERLGVPVTGLCARREKGISELISSVEGLFYGKNENAMRLSDTSPSSIIPACEEICSDAVTFKNPDCLNSCLKTDKVLTSRIFGFPLMLLLFAFIFWLTVVGANYPSNLLSSLLLGVEDKLFLAAKRLCCPSFLSEMLISGVYRCLSWVVSVMLPPMAIFFPLFTLLEDLGYLPRVAFNLDPIFRKCKSCGKQALTMCMGLGCNAVGVSGCQIIDSPRERLIAIITNSLTPCNGRFPTIIALVTMFFGGMRLDGFSSLISTLGLSMVILLSIGLTFALSYILSKTLLRGEASSFVMELPPYRRPLIFKVLIRSILDRTLSVLKRAASVAAPCGLLIWILANVSFGGTALLHHISSFLDPLGRLMGLDGVILMAFILGFPANEIVIPIAIMAYMSQGALLDISNLSVLKELLILNGWTPITAICTVLFSLVHFPCSTTVLTIYKETKSIKWTALSVIIPLAMGISLCCMVNFLCQIFI